MSHRRKPQSHTAPPDKMPADSDLWDRVRDTIKPLAPELRDVQTPVAKRITKPITEPALAVAGVAAKAPADTVSWDADKPYHSPDRKRIKQGTLQPTRSLDLHGFTVARAEKTITPFLQQAVRDGHQWVELITGHGKFYNDGDTGKGVLKRLLPEWLNQPANRLLIKRVLPAPKSRGGAVWVALKTVD